MIALHRLALLGALLVVALLGLVVHHVTDGKGPRECCRAHDGLTPYLCACDHCHDTNRRASRLNLEAHNDEGRTR